MLKTRRCLAIRNRFWKVISGVELMRDRQAKAHRVAAQTREVRQTESQPERGN